MTQLEHETEGYEIDEVLIEQARPSHNGWYAEQIRILIGEQPERRPTKGWLQRAIGRRITRAEADRLVELKDGPRPDDGRQLKLV